MPDGEETDLAPPIICFLAYKPDIVEFLSFKASVGEIVSNGNACEYSFCNSPAEFDSLSKLLFDSLIAGTFVLVRKSVGESRGQELC
jgi:hypothetical protein